MFPGGISCPQCLRTSLFNVFSTESESEIIKPMSQAVPCWSFHNNNSVCKESLSDTHRWAGFKETWYIEENKHVGVSFFLL